MKSITILYDNDSQLKKRKHHKPKLWSTIYYYYEKVKTKLKNNQIVNILSSCGTFQHDTMYKIESLSKKDKIFDYYRILKSKNQNQILKISEKKKKKDESPINQDIKSLTSKDLFLDFNNK